MMINKVPNGTIVHFPHSLVEFIKVEDEMGNTGVVDLLRGEYYNIARLQKSYGLECAISAPNLDALYFGDEDED